MMEGNPRYIAAVSSTFSACSRNRMWARSEGTMLVEKDAKNVVRLKDLVMPVLWCTRVRTCGIYWS